MTAKKHKVSEERFFIFARRRGRTVKEGEGVDRSNVTYRYNKFSRLAPNALGSILVNPSPDKSLQVSYKKIKTT